MLHTGRVNVILFDLSFACTKCCYDCIVNTFTFFYDFPFGSITFSRLSTNIAVDNR